MQFYMIYNDTNMSLNIKQFDTEETCRVDPGASLAYSWRSHKKRQLIQLYLPKYKLTTKPFQINQNGLDEIRLETSQGFYISCLVRVETRFNANHSAFLNRCGNEEIACSFKKFVFLQTRLCVVNALNLDVSNFCFTYLTPNNEEIELNVGAIAKYSRSNYTYELIEIPSKLVDVSLVKINESLVQKKQDFLNKLINGICLYDSRQNIKYWLNLYECKLSETISQVCLVMTPVFVFCSYLPYELDVRLNDNFKVCRLKSNAVSYCSSGENLDTSKIGVRFDRVSRGESIDMDQEDVVN